MDPVAPPESTYWDDPEDWEWILGLAMSAPHTGLDTETIGCDPGDDSAVGRARCVVWSMGIPDLTAPIHPRGYYPSRGFVFPAAALDFFTDYFRGPNLKVLHNERFDRHVLRNERIELVNTVDTINVFRTLEAGLEGYGAKKLAPTFCGYGTYGSFASVFSEEIRRDRVKVTKRALCPTHGLQDTSNRKRCEVCAAPTIRDDTREEWTEVLKSRRKISMQEACGIPVVEGTWDRIPVGRVPQWVTNYAGLDAILASDLWQIRMHRPHTLRKAKVLEWVEDTILWRP